MHVKTSDVNQTARAKVRLNNTVGLFAIRHLLKIYASVQIGTTCKLKRWLRVIGIL